MSVKISFQEQPLSVQLRLFATAQKMKFSIKDFFSKCDQIRSFLEHKRTSEVVLDRC